MRKMLTFIVLMCLSIFHQMAEAKIYDCFLFFNELDILEIRLQELYDHVDYFVLVESLDTFQGNQKPLFYEENKERFEQFADKIIHVIVKDYTYGGNPWDVEAYQRNQIMRGLGNCQPDDIILVSDVDEIPRADILPLVCQMIDDEKNHYLRFEQPICRFYLNCKDYMYPCPNWIGTCATTYQMLCQATPQGVRECRYAAIPLLRQAGWHFTSMGGLAAFIQKIESYSHHEDRYRPELRTQEYIVGYMHTYCHLVPINERYPKYVFENLSLFIKKGFIFEPLVNVETAVRDILK